MIAPKLCVASLLVIFLFLVPCLSLSRISCKDAKEGMDVKGAVRSQNSPDVFQGKCCKACNDDEDCNFWVFATKPDPDGSDCWLLSSIEDLIPAKNRIAGAIDWDLEKVNQDVYQREYQRQQAEQQRQQRASSQHSEGPVCGLSFQIIAILFAAFAGLASVTGSNFVRFLASFALIAVVNPLLCVRM